MWKSILMSTLMIGFVMAYTIGDTSTAFAKGEVHMRESHRTTDVKQPTTTGDNWEDSRIWN